MFFGSVVVLTIFLWLCGPSSVFASISVLGGDVEITGYLRNDFGVRTQDADEVHPGYESGDITLFRNTLQVESKWEMTDTFRMYGIFRAWYDASMDIDSDIEDRISKHARDDFRKDIDLREIYLDYTPKNWLVRIGKQQIVWGESDGFRMADIINPLDYSWHYFFPSWEDIRIPKWGVRTITTFDKFSAEFVFLPNVIDNGFEHTNFPPEGSNWAFAGFPQFLIDSLDVSKPDKTLSASEFGARMKYNARWIDVGVFGFYGRQQDPVLAEDWLTKPGLANGTPDDFFNFPQVMMVGATFNTQSKWAIPGFGIPVLRGECVYSFDKDHQSTDMVNNPKVYEKDTFAYMVGYDAEFYNSFINPTGQSIYHSIQVFQEWLVDAEDEVSFGDPDDKEHMTLITLVLSTNYMANKLNVLSFSMYNPDGETWSKLEFSYTHKRDWNFGVGFQYMGSKYAGGKYFGAFDKNNEAYGWLKYTF
jgi:hypothetical protein